MLYPLQFKPREKKRLWGSESWVVSGLTGDVSLITGGFMKGSTLNEAVEVYMGELVGDDIYLKFGEEFPLLVKYITAHEKLSVQVHPGNSLAASRHNAWGKTELWYILSAEAGAELMIGFKSGVTRDIYLEALARGEVETLLNHIPVKAGDVFFIPAGTVHAIGGGITLAEIQQTSDINYRIFDWNRYDDKGRPRELHTQLALDAIDFAAPVRNVTQNPPTGEAALLIEADEFTTNLVDVAGQTDRELSSRDSFTIYICTAGELVARTAGGTLTLRADNVCLIPADQNQITFEGNGRLLETYI